jgi:release factor glutamine methyltransferase
MTKQENGLHELRQAIEVTHGKEQSLSNLKIGLFGEDIYEPRSFSYLLADWAAHRAGQLTAGAKVVDAGTGSGVVAIAIKCAVQNIEVIASDVSEAALRVAQKNAHANGANICVMKMDLVERDQCDELDLITMHPPAVPYFNESSWGFSEGMALATNGGRDGAAMGVGIIGRARECLKADGELLLLIPHWCARARVLKELDAAFFHVEVLATQSATFFPLTEGRPTPEALLNLWALEKSGEIEVEPVTAESKASVILAACPRPRS